LPISGILTECKSAKSPGRPVFNEMMKNLSRKQYAGIVCWKLDRLARNPIDGSALVWALDQGKIKEILTPHGSFKNNSNDKFLMQIEFGMAKKYVDDLSDNVKRGLRAKLDKGWLPSLPPLGYLNEPKERTIVKDPDRFSLIRQAWDLLFQGYSPSRMLPILNNNLGFRTRLGPRCGGNPLSLSGLYKLFSNPFYYGLIERKEGVFPGKHEPMISEEEYWKAQEILGRPGRPRPKKHNFAFTGLIRCGECGCMITAEERFNRYGSHYTYYHCTRKKINVPCHEKYINLKDLERQIVEYLKKIEVPRIFIENAIQYLQEKAKEETNMAGEIGISRQRALASCQKKIDNLNQMRLKDFITDEEYQKEKRLLLSEKASLELSTNGFSKKSSFDLAKDTFVFASEALARFQKGSPEAKRSILQNLGSNLYLKDRILTIEAEKPLQIIEKSLQPYLTQNSPLEPRNGGSINGKNPLFVLDFISWSTTVEDVRTFYDSLPESENSLLSF